MMKERMMAIIIGGLLLFSVAGFALMGIGRFVDNGDEPVEVPNVMNEYLSGEQVSSILRSGKVLIRDVYSTNCTNCAAKDVTLELFVNSFPGLLVLEEIAIEPDNTTHVDSNGYVKFQMISPTGEVIDLGGKNITQEALTDMFCDISAIQPKECLLRGIGETEVPIVPNNTADQTDDNNASTMDFNQTEYCEPTYEVTSAPDTDPGGMTAEEYYSSYCYLSRNETACLSVDIYNETGENFDEPDGLSDCRWITGL